MCPVPEGKGMRVESRPWCFFAKCKGVEKCSGTKPMRRGAIVGWCVEKGR